MKAERPISLRRGAERARRRPPTATRRSVRSRRRPYAGWRSTRRIFHDGWADTLEAAVDLMLAGGVPNPALDEKPVARPLTAEQRASLLAFLEALSPDRRAYPRPVLPQ